MTRKSSPPLLLTQRALRDIQGIFEFSVQEWGKKTAENYLDQLEAGLERLKERPDLLKDEPEFHNSLRFYRINKHLVVCDTQPNSIVVLTVIHTSGEIADRLAELEPTLSAEVEMLHRKLKSSRAEKP